MGSQGGSSQGSVPLAAFKAVGREREGGTGAGPKPGPWQWQQLNHL